MASFKIDDKIYKKEVVLDILSILKIMKI
jgi:hypothetical protein